MAADISIRFVPFKLPGIRSGVEFKVSGGSSGICCRACGSAKPKQYSRDTDIIPVQPV